MQGFIMSKWQLMSMDCCTWQMVFMTLGPCGVFFFTHELCACPQGIGLPFVKFFSHIIIVSKHANEPKFWKRYLVDISLLKHLYLENGSIFAWILLSWQHWGRQCVEVYRWTPIHYKSVAFHVYHWKAPAWPRKRLKVLRFLHWRGHQIGHRKRYT